MKENKKYEYNIGGKKYTQEKLFFGQIEQLFAILGGLNFPAKPDRRDIINAIGNKISTTIAIVLKVDGQDLKDKDVIAATGDLKFEIDLETTIKIVEDFFLLNPIALLVERLKEMTTKITKETGQSEGIIMN